jgi:hypothetical protein
MTCQSGSSLLPALCYSADICQQLHWQLRFKRCAQQYRCVLLLPLLLLLLLLVLCLTLLLRMLLLLLM